MGIVTTLAAFYFLKRDMKNGTLTVQSDFNNTKHTNEDFASKDTLLSMNQKLFFAIFIPLLFALDVAAMFTLNLQGSDATALIGGISIFILILITIASHKNKVLEKTTSYLIEGFQFGFKMFGPVIPIAAFFYLGDAGFSKIIGDFLPKGSHGIVNALGALHQ
ncbi:transporter [Bacillus methanolicus MGA3]|uniref:Transporter n=1 Tax=Bacillus methanolicus (strain MGA3 / ATCC 53907) TaxID=796606 RepID=A0A068LNJ4_BACMM|nr:transporter [Bacillus methanolicus MGA3]